MEEIKFRNELKYVCTEQQLKLIEQRIEKICPRDRHVGANGTYLIRSVYFDDYHNTCFHENESGINLREKYRIRTYNGDMSRIVLECKAKRNGKNHKESCLLTEERCMDILRGSCTLKEDDPEVFRKFYLKYQTQLFRPKVIVQYERTPFVYPTGNVRITFDRYISGTGNVLDFGAKELPVRPVMPNGQHILEVKYDELIPDFIKSALQIENLRQTAFSKYYMCRKFNLN